jgi:hypothetical protein
MTLSAHSCANHPGVTTSRSCSSCGRPFCEACLTEMAGAALCGWCRDIRLARYHGRGAGAPVNPANVVLWARIFDGVMLVVGSTAFGWFGFVFAGMAAGLTRAAASGGKVPATSDFGVMAGVGAAAALVGVLVFLPPLVLLGQGRSWTWTWQLVATIIAGIASTFAMSYCGITFLPLAVILAVFWVRPEVRAYFHRG